MSLFRLTLVLSVGLAAYAAEYPPSHICWAILVSVVLNWIASAVHEEASELLLGVTPEATHPSPARIIGEAVFNPQYGYVASAVYNGKSFEVVLPTSMISSATSRKETKEMSVCSSRLKPIDAEKLPKSLVALYSDDALAGWGSRIRGPDGQVYLLTALHVWETSVTHLCKDGKKVPIGKCSIAASSSNKDTDFILVQVPVNVWSVLGVGIARLAPLYRRAVVAVYGGLDSKTTFCATGSADLENPFRIVHEASTVEGWSGSPLYHKDSVVGLHLGARPETGKNRGCNVAMAFKVVKQFVTVENGDLYPDQTQGAPREIDVETFEDRRRQGVEFEEYDISGITVHVSDREWTTAEGLRIARYKPVGGGKAWGDEDTQETAIKPLNCQRADLLRDSPPLVNLSSTPVTDGLTQESSIPVACPSDRLESRVAGLEKQLADLSTGMSKLLSRSSQNSESSLGQAEGPKQKSEASSSRPRGLKGSKPPPICNWQSLISSASTPNPGPEPASAASPGSVKTSSKKSRKSRSRAKSTSKPVPESPSQNSAPVTSTS